MCCFLCMERFNCLDHITDRCDCDSCLSFRDCYSCENFECPEFYTYDDPAD